MTRRGFHVLLAFTLLICAICPYVEVALHWNQCIFQSGYDGESTIAIIALVLILAFAVANLLASFVPESTSEEPLFVPHATVSLMVGFADTIPDTSPPAALRI